MNRYENSSPRAAFGIAAVAMTVITVGMLVIVPATIDSGRDELRTLATPAVPALADVAISPAHVDVIAVRGPSLASVAVRNAQARRGQHG